MAPRLRLSVAVLTPQQAWDRETRRFPASAGPGAPIPRGLWQAAVDEAAAAGCYERVGVRGLAAGTLAQQGQLSPDGPFHTLRRLVLARAAHDLPGLDLAKVDKMLLFVNYGENLLGAVRAGGAGARGHSDATVTRQ